MKPLKSLLLLLIAALVFQACQKEKDCDGTISRTFDQTDFNGIKAGSAMQLTIKKGSNFSISATGCSRDVNDLRVRTTSSGMLEIDFDRKLKRRDEVYFDITLPTLLYAELSGAAESSITGFEDAETKLRIALSGASKATVNGAPIDVDADLSGASELNLSGTSRKIWATISGASELYAFNLTASEADITASGASKAFITAQDVLHANASGGSSIRYRGNPATKNINSSGGSEVVAD